MNEGHNGSDSGKADVQKEIKRAKGIESYRWGHLPHKMMLNRNMKEVRRALQVTEDNFGERN